MASIDLPGQDLAILLTPSVADPIGGVRLTWPTGMRLGILGLGGVTETARKAAEERNNPRADTLTGPLAQPSYFVTATLRNVTAGRKN